MFRAVTVLAQTVLTFVFLHRLFIFYIRAAWVQGDLRIEFVFSRPAHPTKLKKAFQASSSAGCIALGPRPGMPAFQAFVHSVGP